MKAKICMLVCTCICNISSAQVVIALLFGDKLNTDKLEFGLVVSPALTNISNNNSEFKTGLNLGIYLNIRPDKRLFLHVEAIAKGALGARSISPYPTGNDSLDRMFSGGSVLRKIKAFSLPALCRYRISGRFFADAGIQADLIFGVKDLFRADVNDNNLQYTIKTNGDYTRFDIAAAGGVFYKFRNDKKKHGCGNTVCAGIDRHL